jgi:hypothetical protein
MELYEIKNKFYGKVSEIETYYLGKYPEAEQKSFNIKVQEALTFLKSLDSNDCPTIFEELKVLYGRDPTQEEITDRCNLILAKKNVLAQLAARISALRQIFEVDPFNFDFNLFEVYFPEVFGTST